MTGSHRLQFNNLKKKKKKTLSLYSHSQGRLYDSSAWVKMVTYPLTLSQNVRQRGWVTLLDQPGTGGANDVQAYSHYKECRRCPSTKGPDQEDWETIRKEWAASVEMTGATGHNWQTREAQGQIDANHRRWGEVGGERELQRGQEEEGEKENNRSSDLFFYPPLCLLFLSASFISSFNLSLWNIRDGSS